MFLPPSTFPSNEPEQRKKLNWMMLVPKTDFKRFYKPSKLYLCVTEINGLIITIYILIFREIILAFAHHPLPEQRLLRCLFTFKFNQVSNGQLLAWSRHRNEHENIITVSCIWASEHLSIWASDLGHNLKIRKTVHTLHCTEQESAISNAFCTFTKDFQMWATKRTHQYPELKS